MTIPAPALAPVSAPTMDPTLAVRRVKATLRGPVLEILADHLPELRVMPRDQVYERTLDDLDLLDRCFKTFRQNRDKFHAVLIDRARRPVETDDEPLACGRTLSQVVAMIVRSAARRYFQRRLARPRPVRVQHAPGLMERLFHVFAPPPPAQVVARPRKLSPAEELYAAIQDYLLHDWQVPLVPTYAEMKPAEVRELGARILELREPSALRAALGKPEPAAASAPAGQSVAKTLVDRRPEKPELVNHRPAAPAQPDPGFVLATVLSADGRRVKPEAFASVLLKPQVRSALPVADQTIHVTGLLRGVGGQAATLMARDLGLGLDQMAVFLVTAKGALGSEVFGRLFGPDADPKVLARLMEHAKAGGLSKQSSLEDCAGFVAKLFSRFTSGKPRAA